MSIIKSTIDTRSNTYQQNFQRNTLLKAHLHQQVAQVVMAGSPSAGRSHKHRGKLLVRDRISLLIDSGTPFLEIGQLAAFEVYDNQVPCAGVVAGIGQVSGHACMIVANDATVKGGTYYPLTVKKHLRAQEIAKQNFLPCIYLVDSGGANLPHQSEVFPDKEHFGRIFFNQARMSAAGIFQLAVVMGSCTAGGAYIPAMADETIIVRDQGTIFLAGPPLVKAATGEVVTAEALGGAEVHTQQSGVADYIAENDAHALLIARNSIAHLPSSAMHSLLTFSSPLYDEGQIYGLIPETTRQLTDVYEVIARLVDGSDFHEFKKGFADTLVCGFAQITGCSVGIVANHGVLFSESAQKGAHFIQLCEQRRIPLIFLQNITGFMVGSRYEAQGIAKHGAKLVNAVACSTVPKVTVIIGGSFGAGNYGMCGRAYEPRFLWSWPNARIAVMGGNQAADVMTDIRTASSRKKGVDLPEDQVQRYHERVKRDFEKQSCAFYATARLWDDGIIDPAQTRSVLSLCLQYISHITDKQPGYGVFRM